MWFDGPNHLVRADHVDRVNIEKVLLVDTLKVWVGIKFGARGVVDQVIDATPGIDRGLCHGPAVVIIGYICLYGNRFGTLFTTSRCRFLGLSFTARVIDDYVAAAPGEHYRGGGADPGRRAGDNRNFSFRIRHDFLPAYSCCRNDLMINYFINNI